MSQTQLSIEQARRLAHVAQGLDRNTDSVISAVRSAGFVRTLGGAEAYLAIRERCNNAPSRQTVDDLLSEGQLAVCPAVRGCIYLVPANDVAWSIACADLLSRRRRHREHQKVGLSAGEIKKLGSAILKALESEALSTAGLRDALPNGAIRSFGDVGKQIGLSSSLPPVLRELEFQGLIERRVASGRLDSEIYNWHCADARELAELHQTEGLDAAVVEHMAGVYLASWPLASVNGLAHWSGFGKRLCKSALEALTIDHELVECAVEGVGERLIPKCHLDRLNTTVKDDGDQQVSFIPFLDSLFHYARGASLFAAEKHQDVEIPKRGMTGASTIRDSSHLGFRSVFLGDEMVGFWEYDPDQDDVALGLFPGLPTKTRTRIQECASPTATFLNQEIGHGRSFNIDTEKDQRRRVVWFSEL